jgi:hypothetical protein
MALRCAAFVPGVPVTPPSGGLEGLFSTQRREVDCEVILWPSSMRYTGSGSTCTCTSRASIRLTPGGKSLFQMCGVFAEFERAMIQERIKAGLARAKRHGTESGRPIGRPRVAPDVERRVLALRRKGHGIVRIAKEVGCGVGTVQRIVT